MLTSASSQESLAGQALSAGAATIAQAIKHASTAAGVDFSYLMAKAGQESGFNPNAKASTSSATGLFQFIDQTWLRTVKTYGEKYGLGALADKISIGADGVARVNDAKAKQSILALRTDPGVSADMAAELTNANKQSLQNDVGGKIGPTELYLAHFLGAGGASDFLNEMRSNPNANAAAVLPEAAEANPSVFYDKAGNPRSLQSIYQHFAAKFDSGHAQTMVAEAAQPAYSTPVSANVYSQSMASADDYASGSTLSAMSNFKSDIILPSSSSLFATMMLAQMNTGDEAASALGLARDSDENGKKKSVIAMLAEAG